MISFKTVKYATLTLAMLINTAFATETSYMNNPSNKMVHINKIINKTSNQPYKSYIETMAANKNIPKEVTIIPVLESGYKEKVSSLNGINVGMWQLNRSMAHDLGLKVNNSVDERKDWKKSTDLVLNHLQRNAKQNFNNNYDLAVLAYNVGTKRVKDAMKKYKTDDASILVNNNKLFNQQVRDYYANYLAYKKHVSVKI